MSILLDSESSRRAFLSGGFVAALALSGCGGQVRSGQSTHAGRRQVSDVQPLQFDPGEGLAAINSTRRKHRLNAFAHDPRLQQAAQNHADYLASTGQFGHEFGGETLFPKRIAAVGFEGSAGENIGVGYGSIGEAIQGWLDSPKHREVFMRRRYDLAGIAYSFNRSGRNPKYTHYWVMVVGENPPPGMRMGPMIRRG
jgi:hypothetical protein